MGSRAERGMRYIGSHVHNNNAFRFERETATHDEQLQAAGIGCNFNSCARDSSVKLFLPLLALLCFKLLEL